MSFYEILLIGAALSMDAFAVGMTDGMSEPRMSARKRFLIAFLFGFFQFAMPLAGYYCGAAFASAVKKIAPYLSFAILGVIGGKMLFDGVRERLNKRETVVLKEFLKRNGAHGTAFGTLVLQAVATSLDALAVGVSLLATETSGGLPLPVAFCALTIGATTFCLSVTAIDLGRRAGRKADFPADLLGGAVLLAIGLKLLLEGIG